VQVTDEHARLIAKWARSAKEILEEALGAGGNGGRNGTELPPPAREHLVQALRRLEEAEAHFAHGASDLDTALERVRDAVGSLRSLDVEYGNALPPDVAKARSDAAFRASAVLGHPASGSAVSQRRAIRRESAARTPRFGRGACSRKAGAVASSGGHPARKRGV